MSPRNSWPACITGSLATSRTRTVMEHTVVLMMAGVTSLGTFILGVKGLRLSGSDLWAGLGRTCESIGLTLVFFALNLIVGLMFVYAARRLMGRFVTLYSLSDVTLL